MTSQYSPTSAFLTAELNVAAVLKNQEPNIQLLAYSLYKQTKYGDVQGTRPGFFNPEGGIKFDAWTLTRGMAHEEADTRYLNCADHIVDGKPLNEPNSNLLDKIKKVTSKIGL